MLAFGFDGGAEGGEAFGVVADVVEGLNFRLLQTGARVGDEVSDETVQDALQGLVEFQLVGGGGIDLFDLTVEALEGGDTFADFFEREEMGFVPVVEVGGVVGDFVGQVDELRF